MDAAAHADILALEEEYVAAERDARALVTGLTAELGVWRPGPKSWSVAHCLDHLATANRVYLQAILPPAERALTAQRLRRRPVLPGLVGGWFVRKLEPPVTVKMWAPRKIVPRPAPALEDAAIQFFASQVDVRAFLKRFAEIDLTGVRFPNPFVPGVRFSLATGLHVIAAHNRRHLWQAWRVRKAAEQAVAA